MRFGDGGGQEVSVEATCGTRVDVFGVVNIDDDC